MKLKSDLLKTVNSYFELLEDDVEIVLQKGNHLKKDDLSNFLNKIVSLSDKLSIVEAKIDSKFSPITFSISKKNKVASIFFSGIPGGHEFNSFILAILHVGGHNLKLDKSVVSQIKSIDKQLDFQVFVSLDCQICPEVVQAVNKMASLNSNIKCETLDGGVFQDLVKEKGIQAVPTIFLNGKFLSSGKSNIPKIISSLKQKNLIHSNTKVLNKSINDCIVIGGGPAGISSAVYLARKGLEVTLIAETIGGQVKETLGIENLISVIETTGEKLTSDLHGHLLDYDVQVKEQLLVDEIKDGHLKKVYLSSGEILQTKTIIIATGARWRELNIPGEKENLGKGVAYCPHCDGPFFKDKEVAVVGGGNSGVEAALDLSGIVNKVSIIEFMPKLKADQILIDKVKQSDNIEIFTNTATKEIIHPNGKVEGILCEDRGKKIDFEIKLSGVFVQIGLVPNSKFVDNILELNQFGEIVIDKNGNTSKEGIFACGDVTTIPYKQIVISMGEGAKTALSVADYLMKDFDHTKIKEAV